MKKITKVRRQIFRPLLVKAIITFAVMGFMAAAVTLYTQDAQAESREETADIAFKPFENIVQTVVNIRGMMKEIPGRITEKKIKYYDVPISDELQMNIKEICDFYDIETELILAMIKHESGFDAEILGDEENSVGLMQIQPKWHLSRMERLGVTDLSDPVQNVRVGADLLSELIKRGKGTEWALMAYNGGENMADRLYALGEISLYAQKVMQYKEEINYRQEENGYVSEK